METTLSNHETVVVLGISFICALLMIREEKKLLTAYLLKTRNTSSNNSERLQTLASTGRVENSVISSTFTGSLVGDASSIDMNETDVVSLASDNKEREETSNKYR